MIDRTIHRAAWQITAVVLIAVAGNRLIGFILNAYVFTKLRDDPAAHTAYVSSAITSTTFLFALSAICYYVSLRCPKPQVDHDTTSSVDAHHWFSLGLRLLAVFLIATAIPKAVGQIAIAFISTIPEARATYLASLVDPMVAIAIAGILVALASKYSRSHLQPDNTE